MSDDYHRLQEVTRPDFRRINKGKVGDRFVDSNAGKEIHEKSTRSPERKKCAPLEASWKSASSSEMSGEEDYLKARSSSVRGQKKKTIRTNVSKPKKSFNLHDLEFERLGLIIDESPRTANNVLNEFKEKFTELQEKTQNEIIQIQQRGDMSTTASQHKLEQDKLRDVITDIQKQFVAMDNFLQSVRDTTEFKENTIPQFAKIQNFGHDAFFAPKFLTKNVQTGCIKNSVLAQWISFLFFAFNRAHQTVIE